MHTSGALLGTLGPIASPVRSGASPVRLCALSDPTYPQEARAPFPFHCAVDYTSALEALRNGTIGTCLFISSIMEGAMRLICRASRSGPARSARR